MPDDGIILAFHQTSRHFYPGINNVSPRRFEAILPLLQEWGYHFYGPGQTALTADSPKELTLTFDDGYADNFEILENLLGQGIRPFVFIPSDYIGRGNSWDYSARLFEAQHLDENQIRYLSDRGVEFGSHGATHSCLTHLDNSALQEQLLRSKNRLEDITGSTVNLLSFPFGRYDKTVIEAAKECGYVRGFGLADSCDYDDSFVRPRLAIYGCDDYYSLRAKLAGGSFERFKARVVNRLAAGTIVFSERFK